jgi:hypothetical protein
VEEVCPDVDSGQCDDHECQVVDGHQK